MMDLEGELVRSSFDPKTRICSYTFERGGKRWTIRIPENELLPKDKAQRRNHLANLVETAMHEAPEGAA